MRIVPTVSALNLKKTSKIIPITKGTNMSRTSTAKLIQEEKMYSLKIFATEFKKRNYFYKSS